MEALSSEKYARGRMKLCRFFERGGWIRLVPETDLNDEKALSIIVRSNENLEKDVSLVSRSSSTGRVFVQCFFPQEERNTQ